jgi:hypothetical protein
MMKRLIKPIFILIVVAVSMIAAAAQSPGRIRFARRATSAVVSGSLSGYRSSRTFLIRVRDGQTLRTEQVGDSQDITIYITDPKGRPVGDSDASCNNRREITPTTAGDYRIKVIECQKADPWRGRFRFRVTVR